MQTSKLYAPAMPSAAPKRFKHSAIGGFWRRLVEFRETYALYRKFGNARILSARMARDIAFKPLPF